MIGKIGEEHSLRLPVGFASDGADFAFGEGSSAAGVGRQEEEVFLDVGGQCGEVQDLGQAGAGDLTGAGEVGLGRETAGR